MKPRSSPRQILAPELESEIGARAGWHRNMAVPSAEVFCVRQNFAFARAVSDTCAPATAADCGSTTLTLRSAAEAAAERSRTKKDSQRIRAYLPPLHAKEVEVDGSRRSPGFASKDGYYHPVTPAAFPGFLPVADGSFLAYSCAAARDLHPLPCLRRAAKTRVPNDSAKSKNNRPKNLTAALREVNAMPRISRRQRQTNCQQSSPAMPDVTMKERSDEECSPQRKPWVAPHRQGREPR